MRWPKLYFNISSRWIFIAFPIRISRAKSFWSTLKVISLPVALVTFFFLIVPNMSTFRFFKVSENLTALPFNRFVENSWKSFSYSAYAFVSFCARAGSATTPDESCNSGDSSSPNWFDMQLMVDRIFWISSSSRVIFDLSSSCPMQGSWFWPAISLHSSVMTALAGWEITNLCTAALCCVNPVVPSFVLESRLEVEHAEQQIKGKIEKNVLQFHLLGHIYI